MTAKELRAKSAGRLRRKMRIRAKISGTAAMPRLSVFRSNRYLSAQAIDDTQAVTLAAINSKALGLNANKEGAVKLAEAFAKTLKEKGLSEIVFDRNGYQYHGVVAAFGDALRANEIKF